MRNLRDLIGVPVALASRNFLVDLRASKTSAGVVRAVANRDTAAIFDWLVELIQLTGIADAAAFAYSDRHGLPTHEAIRAALPASCSRLRSYWQFADCGFAKAAATCAEPTLMAQCPVATIPARNGRLAQTAFSLALFLRDVCDDDLVGWIDARLATVSATGEPSEARELRAAVLTPLTGIFGVSNKVVSMAMADLLLVGDPERRRWILAGGSMIAIDTLVHNFLHRTGALAAHGRPHAYGPACYQPKGCAELLETFARSFDARTVNPAFPAVFPRFVQHAIWSFCAAGHWDICNGNRIDDTEGCRVTTCPVRGCARTPLSLVADQDLPAIKINLDTR